MGYVEMSDEQLVHKALETERHFVGLRFRHSQHILENTAELRLARKEFARLKTEARKREVDGGLIKGSLFAKHRRNFRFEASGVEEQAAEKGGFLQGIVDKLSSKE